MAADAGVQGSVRGSEGVCRHASGLVVCGGVQVPRDGWRVSEESVFYSVDRTSSAYVRSRSLTDASTQSSWQSEHRSGSWPPGPARRSVADGWAPRRMTDSGAFLCPRLRRKGGRIFSRACAHTFANFLYMIFIVFPFRLLFGGLGPYYEGGYGRWAGGFARFTTRCGGSPPPRTRHPRRAPPRCAAAGCTWPGARSGRARRF